MSKIALLLTVVLAVFLLVDRPVSALQFDIVTLASTVSLIPDINKQIAVNKLSNGNLRVLIYGLNQTVFQGKFATVDGDVLAVSNVVGANPDATNANCNVLALTPPKNLREAQGN